MDYRAFILSFLLHFTFAASEIRVILDYNIFYREAENSS